MALEQRGLFITFEGGEGTGKTTLIDKLAEALTAEGLSVVKTRNPGGTELGQQLRHWLLANEGVVTFGPRAELMLFLADRVQHIEEQLLPALAAGKIILCDRYNDSSVAYQGAGRRLGVGAVRDLCTLACGGLEPDKTFYLDLDPQIGLARARKAVKEETQEGETDRIESEALAFHTTVRAAMRQLAQEAPERIITIDAGKSADEVYSRVLSETLQILKAKGYVPQPHRQ